MSKVTFGEQKAITEIYFDGTSTLAVTSYVPIQGQAGKPAYKQLIASIEITDVERRKLVHLFGGTP